jgi:phosphonate transport system substrate-binding protein
MMNKNICLSIFIIMLLFTSPFAVADSISLCSKNVAIAHDNPENQPSVFTTWWNLLLEMLIISGYSGTQDETVYEPRFSKVSSIKAQNYLIGIHPLHNPQRLFEVYEPIVDFLNLNIPEAHFKLEASRNYEEFEKKLYGGYFDFAMPNPYQTVNALKHGYRVFGKMADDQNFRGIILVRRDSTIKRVTDLKGKVVAYPAKTALAATMMPQYYLQTHGININVDIENRYVGSQESAIMNVLEGHVAAGATWPVPWQSFSQKNPELAAQLEVKWQTEALQNNGWVVHKNVPGAIIKHFAATLFRMNQDEQGRIMLAQIPVSRFEAANNATYQPVRRFLQKFSQTVRPVE